MSGVRMPSSRARPPHPRPPRRRRPDRATSAASGPPRGSCRSGWPDRSRPCAGRSRGSARTDRGARERSCAPRPTPRAACRRSGQHARLVGEDVAEQVFRDEHVERGGSLDQHHRAGIDESVLDVDVGEVVRTSSTTLRQRREVESTLALSTLVSLRRRPRKAERERDDRRTRPRCAQSCRRQPGRRPSRALRRAVGSRAPR